MTYFPRVCPACWGYGTGRSYYDANLPGMVYPKCSKCGGAGRIPCIPQFYTLKKP